jgi:hypothetical protein
MSSLGFWLFVGAVVVIAIVLGPSILDYWQTAR